LDQLNRLLEQLQDKSEVLMMENRDEETSIENSTRTSQKTRAHVHWTPQSGNLLIALRQTSDHSKALSPSSNSHCHPLRFLLVNSLGRQSPIDGHDGSPRATIADSDAAACSDAAPAFCEPGTAGQGYIP
jgi:hypothetical protein